MLITHFVRSNINIYFCVMVKEQNLILINNVDLVKSIEDKASSMYSYTHKIEKPGAVENKIYWHKFKQN